MKLKKIELENIRSYEKQEIEFPEGSTLLTGDIGSGKTTILLAIEFALFGLQPGQRGNALLKNGKQTGKVKLCFEVEDKEIIIERNLKRGNKSISQEFASIEINGDKKELSVTELKSRILDILEYPKEFSKKQNILYKFTVYTPQEEMKQIILQDSDTRINTLRHVFGIDKYKKILENVSIVTSKIREERKIKEGMLIGVEQEKSLIETKQKEIIEKKIQLNNFEIIHKHKLEIKNKLQKEKSEILQYIQKKNDLQKEFEKTKIMISSKNDYLFANKKKINQLQEQIEEIRSIIFNPLEIEKLENEIILKKQEKEKAHEENLIILSEINSINLKDKDNKNIKDKLAIIEVCPTCLQDVNENYKSNVIKKIDNSFETNKKRIEELQGNKQETDSKITEINREIIFKEKRIEELKILKIKIQGIQDKQEEINEIEKLNNSILLDIEMLEKHLVVLRESILTLSKYDLVNEQKQKELEIAIQEERKAEIQVAELKKEIYLNEKSIQEIQEKIIRAEEIKKKVYYLGELEDWLSKRFIPLVSSTEKNVMIKLKSEFSRLFKEWFSMLVAENFEVRLDEDFTPIIEQQDYEIDYVYLSGGEKTAIALAYRLALNQVINSLMSKIKTKDIVILDEPTDGFSDAQLDKMREVLQELNIGQLIIVSHERKIEDFVDNVIRLKKEQGISIKD